MQTSGIVSLVLLAVIALGAYKVWRLIVSGLNKVFKNPSRQPAIRKAAFLFVALTVVSMLTPFLLPFNSSIRVAIYAAYALYAVLGLSQIRDWVSGLLNRGKTPAGK